jgi:mannose-6-phosphate isomerase-like protein (cupin superfamily)
MLTSERRPWGVWEEYLNEPGYRLKRLIVESKQQLSVQKHFLRSEFWVVVQGAGKVVVDGLERGITVGDQVHIPKLAVHTVENTGADQLVIIETQIGICLESDIVRLKDKYGRV